MRTCSVSVIIRDDADMLQYTIPCFASLDTLLKEVVFIDDESTDGSKEKAFEIASHFRHMPIVWIEHPMVRWDEQRNLGLDACTGDFIFSLDSDMSFTGNARFLFEQDRFDGADIWDFKTYTTRSDLYHYDGPTYDTFNRTTRLIKNSGVRYIGKAHEQPTVYSGVAKTGVVSIREGDRPKKGFCPDMHLFHLCALASDENLLRRGQRLVDRWIQEMREGGMGPGHPERYLDFKRQTEPPPRPIPQQDANTILTMEIALRNWGK